MTGRPILLACVAALAAACGGPRPVQAPWGSFAVTDDAIPAVADLETWLAAAPGGPDDRLLRSFVLEAAGELDAAVGVLLEDPAPWPEAQELARVLRVGALRHDAPAFDQWVGPAAPVLAADESVPGPARLLWADLAVLAAYRDHRYAMAPGLPETGPLGAPSTWSAVGPLSSFDVLDLERVFRVASGPSLPERVGDGATAPRTVRVPTRAAGMTIPYGTDGVYLAETFLTVDGTGVADLLVSCASPFVVTIDGVEVARRDVADALAHQVRFSRVHLGPGGHRVLVQAGVTGAVPFGLQVVALGGLRVVSFDAEPVAWRRGDTRVVFADRGLSGAYAVPFAADGLAWLAAADAAIGTGDGTMAGRLVDLAGSPADVHPVVAYHLARLADVAYEFEPTDRAERALAAATAAADGWAEARSARLRIAAHHRSEEQWDAAWRELQPLLLAHPDDFAVQSEAARLAASRGWDELRREALRSAAAAFPRHCPTIADLLDDMVATGEPVDPAALPSDWLVCDQTWRTIAVEYHVARGELREAHDIAVLLYGRNPSSDANAVLAADLAVALGDTEGARALVDAHTAWTVDSGARMAWLADEALAEGAVSEAADWMALLRAAWPVELADLVAQAFVSGEPVLADSRRDGVEIVADYVAGAHAYEAAVVYVWDFARTRYFEDGSALDHVHQIVQVRSRDALANYGEVGVPSGALLLRARTLKPDGRAYVPDDIAGKDSISMPNLERGDFIELEWVSPAWGPTVDPPAVRSDRFYFRSFDGPFHASVAEYVAPEAWGEPTVDLRGTEPTYVRAVSDGLQFIRVAVRQSEPPSPDPRSVPATEWLPSVQIAWNYDWELARRVYADALVPLLTPTDSLRRGVRQLLDGASTDRERVRRLFRFVSDEIPDFGGFFGTPATWTWESGEGERTPLLLTMLEVAGFEPDLVFVRPRDQDHALMPIPDASVYDLTAVRVPIRGGEVWLEPDFELYPFDYLRLDAQGCDGIVIWGPNAGRRVTTPTWPVATERNTIDVAVDLHADGNATIRASEVVPLRGAHGFRLYAQSAEDERLLARELESALSTTFPGIGTVDIAIDGLDDPDAPIRITYGFESAGFATPANGGLVFDGEIFSRPLANWYGERPSRDRTMLVGMAVIETLDVTIQAPDGWSVAEVPAPEHAEIGDTSWSRIWHARGSTATLSREIHLPIQRVEPDAYPAFAAVLGALQAGDRMRVVFERRAGAATPATGDLAVTSGAR